MVLGGELPDGSEYLGSAEGYRILRRAMAAQIGAAATEACHEPTDEDELDEDEQANNQEDK